MFKIIIIDEETFRWIVGAFGVLVLLVVVTLPSRPALKETPWGKAFAGLAVGIVVAFVFFVWIYARAE